MVPRVAVALLMLVLTGCVAAATPASEAAPQVAATRTSGEPQAAALALTEPQRVAPRVPVQAQAAPRPEAVATTTPAEQAGQQGAPTRASGEAQAAPRPEAVATVAPAEQAGQQGAPTRASGEAQAALQPEAVADLSQALGPAPDPACDGTLRLDPLPVPGSPRAAEFFRAFREPLAPAPLYAPPGPRRVGLQAGHWLNDQVPPELGRLQAGAVGGGKQEWEVNLDVARRTAALLEAAGVQVDVIPATVPRRYRANLFVAIHSDGDPAGQARGFKVARPGFSSIPSVDDKLVDTLSQVYGVQTDLPRDDEHISLRMRYYYAFNSRRYCHAVAPGVPQAIIELAYLTSPTDRQWLIGTPDRLAKGLSDGIQAFLAELP